MVSVFNVGQGDSILLHPEASCVFTEVPLLVDCGPKLANVHLKFDHDLIDVLITHSHQDHIGGLINVASRIRRLFIPYYLPEIWRIFNYLSFHLADDVVRVDLNSLKEVVIIGEGDRLCSHLEVLNPPKWPHDFFIKAENSNLTIREALAVLRNSSIELPENDIINYRSEVSQLENVIFGVTGQKSNIEEYLEVAQSFVHNFFISLAKNFEASTEEEIDLNEFIQTHFENYIHQTCIVFNYSYLNKSKILFTGDANKKVFNRLIKKEHPFLPNI